MTKKRQQKGAAIAASSSLAPHTPTMPLPPSLLLHNKKERAYKRLESLCSTCATSLKDQQMCKEIGEP
ncbi:unnamed protein product [Sphagnum troendelagicum]